MGHEGCGTELVLRELVLCGCDGIKNNVTKLTGVLGDRPVGLVRPLGAAHMN